MLIANKVVNVLEEISNLIQLHRLTNGRPDVEGGDHPLLFRLHQQISEAIGAPLVQERKSGKQHYLRLRQQICR